MRADVYFFRQSAWITWVLFVLLQVVTGWLPAQVPTADAELQQLPTVDQFAAPVWLKPAEPPAPAVKKQGWAGSLEMGINGSEGNSTNFNLHTGIDLERRTIAGVFEMDFDYTKVTTSNVIMDHHALLDMEHKWVGQSRFGAFVHLSFDYDEFKAFDSRISTNAGADYHWIDNARTAFVGRLGAGLSREIGGPVNKTVPEAVFGLRLNREITDRQQFEIKFDYFPDWSRFVDFRLETDAGWKILLDEANRLSLKFELNDRYDNTPSGLQSNDLTYAVLLLWDL